MRLVAPAINGPGVVDARSGNDTWNGRIRLDRVSGGLPSLYGVSSVGSFMAVFPEGLATLASL